VKKAVGRNSKTAAKKVGEWCKEHWKAAITIVIVIAAVILVATGVGGILGAMALGALFGTGIGGLFGGIISAVTGGSFWMALKTERFQELLQELFQEEWDLGCLPEEKPL
jgi:uncharacterized membrane protein YdjX (TVP38/TMEM64 family)